ncbi:MAG: MFS transporter [Rectinemataceae bacterium]|nr:MFS transporter [Spirochaetaceae bacterium]
MLAVMEQWRKSFNALMIAEFLAIVGFSTSNPIIPLYLRELGITDVASLNLWTGAINGASAFVMAMAAPIWGALADSYGRKIMLLRAMVGGAIIMGLLALTNAPWQVLLLKTIQGAITGTVSAATVLTASLVPAESLGYYMGLLQMAVFTGNSAGPMFGGFITDIAGSRMNFLATSVLLAGAAILVFRHVRETWIPTPRTGSVLRNAIPDLSLLNAKSPLRSIFIVVFVIQAANAMVGPIIPLVVLHLQKTAAFAGSISGLIIGVASLAGALGAVVTGKVSVRMGYDRALLACIGGAFLAYLPQGLVQSPWQLLVLRALSGFFMGGTMPTANALIGLRSRKERQGATFGMSSAISNSGASLGPVVGATVATLAGYQAAFFVTTLLLGMLSYGIYRAVLSRR